MNQEKTIAEQLTLAYIQAGRSIDGKTIVIVAQSLDDALDFSDENEVRAVFKKAKDMSDIPTQKTLKEALVNYRAEHTAYIPRNDNTPKLESDGGKIVRNGDEMRYMMATQRLSGIYFGMDEQTARNIVEKFESEPKNEEMKNYQRRWIAENAKAYRAKLDSMGRAA